MGSRMMHLIIANRIADRLNLKDRAMFLLGSIAPDAVQTKNESHFFKGEHHNYTRYIDYDGFLDKYRSYSDHLYVLGYYSHLIADDQWLKGFYMPWLRNRMEADEQLYSLYHKDFRRLNGKLLKHYRCTEELRSALINPPEVIDLQEVKSSDVEQFVPSALEDLDDEDMAMYEPLNVFNLIQIIGYIETSVDIGMMNLQKVMKAIVDQKIFDYGG